MAPIREIMQQPAQGAARMEFRCSGLEAHVLTCTVLPPAERPHCVRGCKGLQLGVQGLPPIVLLLCYKQTSKPTDTCVLPCVPHSP